MRKTLRTTLAATALAVAAAFLAVPASAQASTGPVTQGTASPAVPCQYPHHTTRSYPVPVYQSPGVQQVSTYQGAFCALETAEGPGGMYSKAEVNGAVIGWIHFADGAPA